MIAVAVVLMLRDQNLPDSDQTNTQIRVLIVESDEVARDALTKSLRFDKSLKIVGAACTGSDALEIAEQLEPNVILLDLSLADMDSLNVAESLSQRIPGLRFVFLQEAALPMTDDWPWGLPELLVKPIDYRQLIEALNKAERLI